MKRRTPCVLLVLPILAVCIVPAVAQGESGVQLNAPLVLAFYYAWYDQTTWQKPLPDLPAPTYVSSDTAAIERHVLWAQQAGIDAFVQSWYGPQVENNQTETNFSALLDIAGQHGFRAAVDLEVTGPFIHSEADVIAALQYVLTVHANHPAYLRVGGKPVLFFWRQDRYSVESWNAIRDQVDAQRASLWIMEGTELDYLGPFDGDHLYSVAWDAEPEGALVRWGQRVRDWSDQHGAFRYWVATVMPGYDDRVTGRANAFVRERAGGDYYCRCWGGAAQSGADMVIVTSFNEWMEGTQIEPSVGYGDLYLSLTRELGDQYRVGVLPTAAPQQAVAGPAATPTPLPSSPPTAPPSPTPSPSATPTSTPLPTSTLIPTPTATPTRTPRPTSTATPMPTFAPIPTPTPTLPQSTTSFVRSNLGLIAGGLALVLVLAVVGRRRRM
jgi:hypothetical protein